MNDQTQLTKEETQAAGMQGWGIFFTAPGRPLQVQRIDDMFVFCPKGDGEPIFVGDGDALLHVQAAAQSGDALAQKAIAIVAASQAEYLKGLGWTVGPRDPRVNTAFAGQYMVCQPHEPHELPTRDASQGPWAVVGDDLADLVCEAWTFINDHELETAPRDESGDPSP